MDTDSLVIAATEMGGLIPCPGGAEQMPDGTEVIRALSCAEVEQIRDRFRALNPYGDGESILELEDENYAPCSCGEKHKSARGCTSERRQLYAYSVASKRYVLFYLDTSGDVVLRGLVDGEDTEDGSLRDDETEASVHKYSEHGLGAYEDPRAPVTGKKIEKWEREVWHFLIQRGLRRPVELPAWAHQPVLTQVRISTPEQLRWFDTYNRTAHGKEKPYAERVKPFNFLGHPMPRPLSALLDGEPCRPKTQGLLQDLALVVSGVRHVGKEGNELESHQAGLVTEAERQLEYHVSALEDLIAALQKIPTKVIAEVPGYNPRTVRRLKRAEFRPSSERLTDLTRPISGMITNGDRGHGASIDEHAATATP